MKSEASVNPLLPDWILSTAATMLSSLHNLRRCTAEDQHVLLDILYFLEYYPRILLIRATGMIQILFEGDTIWRQALLFSCIW